jgi:hypothetical protein
MQTGGYYIAEDRGAFDLKDEDDGTDVQMVAATAPLFEIAAAHDNEPPTAWLKAFYRRYGEMA